MPKKSSKRARAAAAVVPVSTPKPERKALPRDARAYESHFPNVPHLSSKRGTYEPLPWYLRSALWLFRVRTWQLFTYFIMRGSRFALSWATDKEIAHDVGIGPKKVGGYLRELKELGFILTAEAGGARYVIVVDPLPVLQALAGSGRLRQLAQQAAGSGRTADGLLLVLNEDLAKAGLPELPSEGAKEES